ncbi:hypothetical protein ACFFLS_24430 [Flavobacterium procerum]|uniref:C1q domain-containing protein n=1 Tax=Flavobacterium procerum TaxID=1455569 RepID=A0ABV6BXN9_9FLAO
MRKLFYILLLLIQTWISTAQTKTVLSPYGEKITINPYTQNGVSGNAGFIQLGGDLTQPTVIKTSTDNTLSLELPTSTDTKDTPIVVTSDGTLKKGAFPSPNIVPDEIGTIIAINGKLEVAQEITVLLGADFNFDYISATTPSIVGNLTNVLIDNKNMFTGSATTNSFKVAADGVYLININASIINGRTPVIGVWCNDDNKWIARINSYTSTRANITLITAVSMSAAKTYSFRTLTAIATGTPATLEAFNSGTLAGSVFSVKRLK